MPKKAKELQALQLKRIAKRGHYAAGGVAGLLLQVSATGARSWILRVTIGSKRRDVGLGGYPDVSLAGARDAARAMREKIAAGVDPVVERMAAREANKAAQTAAKVRAITFAEAAKNYHADKVAVELRGKHVGDWLASLERHAFPIIGGIPVCDITVDHVKAVLLPIWKTKTETATRVRQRIETVIAAATPEDSVKKNPARWEKGSPLQKDLPKPTKIKQVEHHRALPWKAVPAFFSELRGMDGMGARALEFAIMAAARSGEVRGATWSEIDFEAALWTIPAARMKGKLPHTVPLTDSMVEILKNLPERADSEYLFPALRGGALSDVTLIAVCRRAGIDATPHGFRSSFKDWARERTSFTDEVSELALAHINSDKTRAAYARSEMIDLRRRMMDDWARFCRHGAPAGGDVVPIRGRA